MLSIIPEDRRWLTRYLSPGFASAVKTECRPIRLDAAFWHQHWNDTQKAWYEADFSQQPPTLFLIHAIERQKGYGYLAFYHFLQKVGQGNEFLSDPCTPCGEKMFAKAVKQGLIRKTAEPSGLFKLSKWQVIGNPTLYYDPRNI